MRVARCFVLPANVAGTGTGERKGCTRVEAAALLAIKPTLPANAASFGGCGCGGCSCCFRLLIVGAVRVTSDECPVSIPAVMAGCCCCK
jgi:hypothetical protein